MAPLSSATTALACMQEIQDECWRMGIPLKTRHREVAPNQYEFAPLFGSNTTQIDQNLMVMQIIEEVAPKHGLAALLQEKNEKNQPTNPPVVAYDVPTAEYRKNNVPFGDPKNII